MMWGLRWKISLTLLMRPWGSVIIPGLSERWKRRIDLGKEANMKSVVLAVAVGLCLALPVAAQDAKPDAPAPAPAAAAASAHVMVRPVDIKWGAAPPVLRKGAELAVMSGDPGSTGPYTVRLKLPAGYKIAPHWHTTDENVTVVSGSEPRFRCMEWDPS
jgi:hypothetical protein